MKIHETEPKLRAAALPALGLGSGLRSLARKRCVLANENSPRKSRRILHRSLTSRERPADGGRSVTLRGEIQGAHTPRHLTQTLRTRASVARTGLCLPISGVPFNHLPGKIWSTSTSLATSPGLDAHAPHVQAPGHVQSHRGCRDTSQTRIVLPNPPVSIRVARLTSPAARLLAG